MAKPRFTGKSVRGKEKRKKNLFHRCLYRCHCGIVGVVVSSLFVVSWCRCGIVVVVVLWLSLWYCVISLLFVWLCCCCLYGCVVVVLLLFIAVVSLLFIVVVSLLLDRERAKAQSHSPVLRLQPIQSAGRKALTQPAGSMILTQHQEKDEKNETSQF